MISFLSFKITLNRQISAYSRGGGWGWGKTFFSFPKTLPDMLVIALIRDGQHDQAQQGNSFKFPAFDP